MYRLRLIILFFIFALNSNAQTTYKDVIPDEYIYGGNYTLKMSPNASGHIDIDFNTTSPGRIKISCFGDYEILFEKNNRTPRKKGNLIWHNVAGGAKWIFANQDTLSYGGHIGGWILEEDGYLGVRFKLAGKWHYGWLRMGIDMFPSYFAIKEWAYNNIPEDSIKAGQILTVNVEKTYKPNTIHPVVHSGYINFEGINNIQGNYKIILADLNGRVLNSLSNEIRSLNTNNYIPGIYIISIKSDKGLNLKFKISLL